MNKFLIVQTAFIGDVVLATAVAEQLHAYYPDAIIDFLLRKGNEALLLDHPYLRKVYVWDKKGGKLKNLWKIAREVRGEAYTQVINIHRFATSGFVTWFSRATEKRGFRQNPFSWSYTRKIGHKMSKPGDRPVIHEVQRNNWLIEDITHVIPAKPRLYPTTADYHKVAPYKTASYICIAASSIWFTKRYPVERWVELVQSLPQGQRLYFLSGPEDAGVADEIIRLSGAENAENLGGKLSLMQSAALMQDAIMNYTNDSGPLHLASSVNAPATAIFCSTDACFGFGPLSDQSRLVEVQGLYCKPCGIHGYEQCPEGHFRCAKEIKTKDLLWWTTQTT